MQLIEKVLPWERTAIYGVGDVQLGSPGCVPHYFRRDMDEAREENAYILGLGDMIDYVRPTMRSVISKADFDNEIFLALSREASVLEEQWLEMTEGTHWLGMVEGHHFFEHGMGVTSDTKLAAAKYCPFLGDSAIVRLTFKRPNSHQQASIDIFIWHGEGSGTAASALNKLRQQAAHWDCDIFLMGHYSQLGTTKFHRTRMTKGPNHSLQSRDITLGLIGGYQKGYVQDLEVGGRYQGTYVEQKGLNPVSLGCLRLYLTPTEEGVTVRASA